MTTLADDEKELLWLVSESDNPIGQVERKKAHDERLIHREVGLIIYDEDKRVLFQKRSQNKRANPGMWSTGVAGHVGYGQKPEDEIKREAEEEVGLKGYKIEFIEKELIETKVERHFKYWFKVKVPSFYKFKLNKAEVDEVRFLSPLSLVQMIRQQEPFYQIFIDRVKKFWRIEYESHR